jgi:putative holliday junction resolvase
MRILGIDYGSKRVGLALGDTDSRIASPWGVITESDELALLARVHDVIQRDLVEEIVIGVPRPLRDASLENEQVQQTKTFIESVKRFGLPVHEVNEALSSQLAKKHVEEAHPLERGRKRGAGVLDKRDDLAASAILQTWLDKKK